MRYLGIDYGAKRIGLAVSDAGGSMAFPRKVLENGPQAVNELAYFCREEEIDHIVLGESLDDIGNKNKVMEEIEAFKRELEGSTSLSVSLTNESMTTLHALGGIAHKPTARFPKKKKQKNDAEAATLILQRFLELQK